MRVLIAEDEALVRMLIRDLLDDAGFECREAGNVDEALAVLDGQKGWRPDILVTDYNLGPQPTGAKLAEHAMRRLPGLPVIYVTGNPECLADLGPRERIVAKPFADTELILSVREHCGPATTSPPCGNLAHIAAAMSTIAG
jgi:CheY-like chemotaxis protein